jgi:hypothetical protein
MADAQFTQKKTEYKILNDPDFIGIVTEFRN